MTEWHSKYLSLLSLTQEFPWVRPVRLFAPLQALPPHLVRWDVVHLPILCLERCGAIKVHVRSTLPVMTVREASEAWARCWSAGAANTSERLMRHPRLASANILLSVRIIQGPFLAHGSHVSLSLPAGGAEAGVDAFQDARGPSFQACYETMYGVHLNTCLSTDERRKKGGTRDTCLSQSGTKSLTLPGSGSAAAPSWGCVAVS